ncbi:hypothetical protein A5893_11890 [Pedobacter psychrophilus]|uniref:Uncharacterized protein n=1 Tax=Pedobacter psychrophilus TaxID=1826909 RepID=A0A179DCV3_9SPHI|nr:hypothetical protein [Pedobacter psychrophilus]OAQ38744.1 hypothetical protein A5893_11890 [Pedobacter psychrophilus]
MKNIVIIFFFLFFNKVGFASYSLNTANDSAKKITIINQQIKCQDKLVGKYTTNAINLEGDKVTRFVVKFFETEGEEIAELKIDLLNKVKKNQQQILDASLNTLTDNVVHNGSNFINYQQIIKIEDNLENASQLKSTINYLLENKYLEE